MDRPYDFKGIADVERLALENPDEYDRLLRGYHRLLGSKPRMWWQDDTGAMDERWPACVRTAIAQLANESGVPVRTLADWLDAQRLPRARRRVFQLARQQQ